MKPGIYLEEALKDVLRTSNFVHGMFNLVVAPCGSGKTTAAINVISKLASSPRTALIAYVWHTASNARNLLEYAEKKAERRGLRIIRIDRGFQKHTRDQTSKVKEVQTEKI